MPLALLVEFPYSPSLPLLITDLLHIYRTVLGNTRFPKDMSLYPKEMCISRDIAEAEPSSLNKLCMPFT